MGSGLFIPNNDSFQRGIALNENALALRHRIEQDRMFNPLEMAQRQQGLAEGGIRLKMLQDEQRRQQELIDVAQKSPNPMRAIYEWTARNDPPKHAAIFKAYYDQMIDGIHNGIGAAAVKTFEDNTGEKVGYNGRFVTFETEGGGHVIADTVSGKIVKDSGATGQKGMKEQAYESLTKPGFDQSGIAKPAMTPIMALKEVESAGQREVNPSGVGRTTQIGSRIKQFNTETGRYDIDVGPAPPPSSAAQSPVELTPDALDAEARYFRKTHQFSPFGMSAQGGVRQRIMNRAAEMEKLEGGAGDYAANQASYKADAASLSKLQSNRDAVVAFEGTALKNLDQFLGTARRVVDSGSPWINTPLRAVSQRGLGSADVAAFEAARRVAVNEIAKVISNPNLTGQLSDAGRREVENFIPENATLAQIYSVAQILKQDMRNRHGELDRQIGEIKGRISGGGTGGGGTVKMRAPDGSVRDVPLEKVDYFRSKGAVLVQ